jgi:prolyl oligopeptidase
MHVRSAAWLCSLALLACAPELPPAEVAPLAAPIAPVVAPVTARKLEVPTRTVDAVDDYFGQKVKDPYRWLEDGDSPEVQAWTAAQNAVTHRYLEAVPGRDRLEGRIKALLEVGLVTAPAVRTVKSGHRRYFHTKREGRENQPILYVRDGVGGADRALIDPSTLSSDATTALDWWFPSRDGTLVAWGHSDQGSEESTLQIRDVAKGTDLGDRIPNTRHASVAWLPGNKAFYYTRYPQPGSVPPGDEKYFRKVFLHLLGDDPQVDALVFGDGLEKTDYLDPQLSPDGRHLVMSVYQGWHRNDVFVRDLSLGNKGAWVPVAKGFDALFDATPRNDRLYLLTNQGAPRYRLVAVDYEHPAPADWKEILHEGPDVIERVALIGKDLFAERLHDAATTIDRFTLDGKARGNVPLPALGTASVSGAWDGDEAFVHYASYVTPPEVTLIDLRTSAPALPWDRVGAGFSAPGVSVSRMYATSKDGTRVPMFVVQKDGTPRDGTTPTVLYGYGGFNVNQSPAFSASALLTVERGGVWVTAILRGGGEFGEAWHRAGMLESKQNTFDDAIGCAEKLIADRVTSPAHLAVRGASNGGLLVAAVVTQRPDLFRVGTSVVPLTDMVRYERFRIAKLWAPEYGSASNPAELKTLLAYSPYHHVQEGVAYPSMLFSTAESDSRVDPMHARKMAARMQAAQTSPGHPILLRVESRAGHGQGKPVSKLVEQLTDELSFLFHELGVAL